MTDEEKIQAQQQQAFALPDPERFDRMKDMLSLYCSAYASMSQENAYFSQTRNEIMEMLNERIHFLLSNMPKEQI